MQYSRWFRDNAARALRQWIDETRLTQGHLAKFLSLSTATIGRLERGANLTHQVTHRLVQLGVIDANTAEPNLALARRLRRMDLPAVTSLGKHSRHGVDKAVKAYRRSQGLTQQALADQLGVSRAAVLGWETARKLPSPPLVVEMALQSVIRRELAIHLLDEVWPGRDPNWPRVNRGMLIKAERGEEAGKGRPLTHIASVTP